MITAFYFRKAFTVKWQTQDITILNKYTMFSFSMLEFLSKFIERHNHNYRMLKGFFSVFKYMEKKSFVSISNMHVSQMEKNKQISFSSQVFFFVN